MTYIADMARLMRPKSWIKNFLVALPVFFSLNLFSDDAFVRTVWAFLGFCLISSGVYAMNDVIDARYDESRYDKKNRPVAAGRIKPMHAVLFSCLLFIPGVSCLGCFASSRSGMLGMGYIAVNMLYTLCLKNFPVADVGCIAAGFVLRVYAGAAACGVMVSEWLFLTVVAASCFMGFGKRYGEMALGDPERWRKSVQGYDPGFLRGAIFLSAGLAVGFYSLWSILNSRNHLVFSVPVLLFLLYRYLLDIFKQVGDGDPVRIFYGDRVLTVGLGVYGAMMFMLLYFL